MSKLKRIHQQVLLGKRFEIYGTESEPLFLARDVADWIEYEGRTGQLLENVDEDEKLMHTIYASGQNRQMWFLTEDGLYEVLFQSRKPIAKQFKKQVKKILKEIRTVGGYLHVNDEDDENIVMAKAILVAQRSMERQRLHIEELERSIEHDAKYTDFGKIVANSSASINVGEYAKLLYEKDGIKIGRNKLMDWMRDNGYLIRQKGRERNLPKQKYIEQGLFEVRTSIIARTEGPFQTGTTLVTGKGQIYFAGKLKEYFESEGVANA